LELWEIPAVPSMALSLWVVFHCLFQCFVWFIPPLFLLLFCFLLKLATVGSFEAGRHRHGNFARLGQNL
jgi:hypothetical protein